MSLNCGEVLVRWMAVDSASPDTVGRWRAWLGEEEAARADRFRFDADRLAYVAGHALVRAVLSRLDPRPPQAWRFVTGPFGKPEIDPALGVSLRFNLSHARGMVAVVVSPTCDVGVDVERCDRVPDVGDLAHRFFAPEEVALVQPGSGDGGRDAFFRLWTLKEAFIKALGDGLRCPLHSFAFTLDPIAVTVRGENGGAAGDWQFFQIRPSARHVVAAAVRRTGGPDVRFLPAAVDPNGPL